MGAGRIRFTRGPSLTYASVTNSSIDIDILRLVLGIRNGRPQNFFNRGRNALVRAAQNVDRIASLLTADHVHDQSRLLRRDVNVARFRLR